MNIRAQINYWLALKQYDYRKLADEMSKLSGRKYTRGSINGKLVRNTLTVQELELIAKILGYKIEFFNTCTNQAKNEMTSATTTSGRLAEETACCHSCP